jgi:hypothetical protein
VENVPAGTTSFVTDYGLTVPGAVKYFRVYVVTNDDNAKSSDRRSASFTICSDEAEPLAEHGWRRAARQ